MEVNGQLHALPALSMRKLPMGYRVTAQQIKITFIKNLRAD
jgi:hypothetical protein